MIRHFLFAAAVFAATMGVAACNSGYGSSTVPTPQTVPTSGPVVIYPGTAVVPLGGSVEFAASIDSQPTATFAWSISGGAGNGSIDAQSGVYTAPTTTIPTSPTVTVTAKTGSTSGTATITITAAQPVTVTPSALFVAAGASVNFAATVGGNPAAVTWSVNGAQGGGNLQGHITPSGVYTAPLTPAQGGSLTITAQTSGGASGTAAATVVFSANSFSGPYAFSYTGTDKNGFLSGAGSFTANGATGTITNGVEDVIDPKLSVEQDVFGGTFTVNPDGTGTASFTDGTAGAVASKFQFSLTGNGLANAGAPSQQAVWMRFDLSGTGSGMADQQDSAALGTPLPLPSYVFGFSGVDGHGHLLNVAGEFTSNGFSLSPGVWDVNDPSLATTAAPVTDDLTLAGTSLVDASRPGSGRGTLTLNSQNTSLSVRTFTYTYYVVDDTHLKVVETDSGNFTGGDIYSAPNSNGFFNASVLKGNYAFATGGSGPNGPFALAGVLIANGGGSSPASTSGSITGGVVDQNGAVGSIVLNASLSTQAYAVTQSSGRITFNLSSSNGGIGSPAFAAYPTASGSILMIETDVGKTNLFGSGFLQDSTAALQGSFATGSAGIPGVSGGQGYQEFAGQFSVTSGAIASGSIEVSNGSSLSGQTITQGVLFPPDSDGRGTATIVTNSASFPIVYYTIDATAGTALFIESDGQRVLIGNLARQF